MTMRTAIWVPLLAFASAARAEDPPPLLGATTDADGTPALVWSVDADGAHLYVASVGTYLLSAQAELAFGSLRMEWSTSAPTVDAAGGGTFDLGIPANAFLHPLAADYVSDLRVVVTALDESGAVAFTKAAPAAYITWPSGSSGPARVLDEAMMSAEAPNGVANAEVRATLGDTDAGARLMPPITTEGEPPVDPDFVPEEP